MKISTSLVGQYRTLEIPNLNTVYEDDKFTLMIHDIEGKGELLVLHADIVKPVTKTLMNHYWDVVQALFEELQKRGIKEIEAWVSTDEEIRFAAFFGFNDMMGQLLVNGRETLPPVFRLKKEL